MEEEVKEVLDEATAASKMAVINAAYDELAVPDQHEGETDLQYILVLRQTIRDLSRRANEFEALAQTLAEANVRQTKIIEKLRADIVRLKMKLVEGVKNAA